MNNNEAADKVTDYLEGMARELTAAGEQGCDYETLLDDFMCTRDVSSFYDLGHAVGITTEQCGQAQQYLNSL